MNDVHQFQLSAAKAITQRIPNNLVELNHKIQASDDLKEIADLSAALHLHKASLQLVAIAILTKERFYLQQAVSILNR